MGMSLVGEITLPSSLNRLQAQCYTYLVVGINVVGLPHPKKFDAGALIYRGPLLVLLKRYMWDPLMPVPFILMVPLRAGEMILMDFLFLQLEVLAPWLPVIFIIVHGIRVSKRGAGAAIYMDKQPLPVARLI